MFGAMHARPWLCAIAIAACSEPAPRPPVARAQVRDAAPPAAAPPVRTEPTVIALGTGTRYRFKGLAIDASAQMAYLGSWDRKQIVAVDLRETTHRVIETKYSGKLNGMGTYLRDGRLYAVMNEVEDSPGARPRSVLLVIDPAAPRAVTAAYELRGRNGRHHFNHVAVDARGIAYVSDTLKSSIHTVDTRNPGDRLRLLVQHEDLSFVHGIDVAPDGSKLFATSYRSGIKVLDLETLEFSPFEDTATAGDDGLKYHQGSLYGVGGNAVKRYVLDPTERAVVRTEVVDRDHDRFNDPRCLHVEDGWLYVLANIELEPVTFRDGRTPRDQPLTDTYLVKYRL